MCTNHHHQLCAHANLLRFLESLSARVHPTPIDIDSLSDLFQEFYVRASSQIDTHIAALSTRLSRQGSATSLASRSSTFPRNARKPSESMAEQQMLTVTEVADRKKARRQLEVKRTALEEAVERAICEKVGLNLLRYLPCQEKLIGF